ncbi:MAG: hypothetical protein LUI60_02900 [Clostridia bacterium]|nr:hypothetical protein [Clostridia bacterium]
MKTKKVLKFYFTADKAERAIDRLILKRAAAIDYYRTAEQCAERVIALIEKKRALCLLWRHLDSAMFAFSADERKMLKSYAFSQRKERGEVHRLAVRFTRRAQEGISDFEDGLDILREYAL